MIPELLGALTGLLLSAAMVGLALFWLPPLVGIPLVLCVWSWLVITHPGRTGRR